MATDVEIQKFVPSREGIIHPTGDEIPSAVCSYLERLTIRALSISFIYVDTCVSEVQHIRGCKW